MKKSKIKIMIKIEIKISGQGKDRMIFTLLPLIPGDGMLPN